MESELNKLKVKDIQPVFDVKSEEESSLTLMIIDFNENYIRLDVKQDITVQMLRIMIQDISYLSFITNYELRLVRTNESLEYHKGLLDYHIVDFDKIKLVTCLYTKSSIEHHLDRLNYITNESPPFINEYISPLMMTVPYSKNCPEYYRDPEVLIEKTKEYRNNAKKETMEQLDKIIKNHGNETKETKQEKSIPAVINNTKKDDNKKGIKLNPKHLSENKTKYQQAQIKEEENLQNQAETNKQLELCMKSISDTRKKIVDLDFQNFALTHFPDSLLYEEQPKPQKFKCFNSLATSIFDKRDKQNGDIKYISVILLENKDIEITCNERGFYLNSSNSTIFNPSPSENPCFSYTLPGVLCQISPLFKENFGKLLSQVLSVDPLLFQPSPQMKFDWMKPQDNLFYCNYRGNMTLHRDSLIFSKKGQREWNEEFQIIFDKKMIDMSDQSDNFYKDKYTDVVYNDFRDSAIEGVKLISEKQLLPINYTSMDNISKGLYIYDNIFLSILEDSYSFQTYNNTANAQTFTGGNLDFRHLNYLLRNKYEQDLNFLFVMSCIVQYKGTRVYAQSIIPGIIYECENMVEYGAMDEGEIKFNENFHNEMKVFANKFRIKENKVVDKDNKEFSMYGNPELKGINNKDKRRYLFDLVHFMPRDLNFYNKENNGCLLRPEVVYSYEIKLIENKIKDKHPEEYKKISNDLIYLRKKIRDYKSFGREYVDKLRSNSTIFSKYFEESEKEFRFNTTLHTNSKLSENVNYDSDEKLLKDLAHYLKHDLINEYLLDIIESIDDCPYDSKSLTESLHRYGINLRYYGDLINIIDKNHPKVLSWLKSLIMRDILIRSASHYFNSLLKDLPEYLIKAFTAHFLNVFITHSNKQKLLESLDFTFCNGKYKIIIPKTSKEENKTEKGIKQKDKKTKKKKNKKKKVGNQKETEVKIILSDLLANSNLCKLIDNNPFEEQIFVKPSEFWKQIREIALKKFNFDIQVKPTFDYVNSSLNKIGLLRDFCLKIGLQINCKEYDLENDLILPRNEFKYEEHLPFQISDIVKFCTVVKELSLPSEYLLNIFNKAEEKYLKLEFEESVTLFNQIILVFPEFFGHINKYLAHAYCRLSSIYYLFGDFFIAINYGIKAIITREKLFEYDNKFVVDCYSDIANYYHYFSQDLMGFKCLHRALEIINFVYPKYHPDKARKLEVLAIQYTEIELLDLAEETFLSALNNYLMFYEEDNFKLVQVFFLLSKIYQKSINLTKSIHFFEKYMNCIINRDCNSNHKKKGEEMKKMRDDLKRIMNVKNPEEVIKLYSDLSNKFMKEFDEMNNPDSLAKDMKFKTNKIERIYSKY